MAKRTWQTYAVEFLSIFVAVISAFALNNWNDNRKERRAESKILTEIWNGLQKDSTDVAVNILGHEQGIRACKFWVKVFSGQTPNMDTIQQYYFMITRDFTSIQNSSGYETLKSRGFELIQHDSLRSNLIELYEYDYQTLQKLEEEYAELQFHNSYFHELNHFIAPHLQFDPKGNIIGLDLPIELKETDRKLLLSYLWKIHINRLFIVRFYREVETKINTLRQEIRMELAQ